MTYEMFHNMCTVLYYNFLKNFDNWADYSADDDLYNEIVLTCFGENNHYTENQPIGIDQQDALFWEMF